MTTNLKIAALPGCSRQQTGDLGGEQAEQASETSFLLGLLSQELNLTYEMISPADNTVGLQQNDGTWTGLVGLILNKEADMAAGRIPFLPALEDNVEFSIPLGIDSWVTLQQQPLQKPRADGLLTPFKPEVWISLAVAVALMGPTMYAIYRLYLKLYGPGASQYFRATWDNFVMFVCVSLIRQDHNLFIQIHSQRILMATWWIVGLLVTTFYTANLTASLARPSRESFIQQPLDLLLPEHQNLRWVTLRGDSLHVLILTKTGGFYDVLRQHLETNRGQIVSTAEEAAKLVHNEDYVWFGSWDALLEVVVANYQDNRRQKNLTSSQWCSFILTDQVYLTTEHGFIFPRNSSIKTLINNTLRRFDQVGITTYIRRNSSAGSNPCALSRGVAVRALRITDFFGLFLLAGAGILLGIVCFVLEMFIHKGKNQLKNNIQQSPLQPLRAEKAYAIVKPMQKLSENQLTEKLNSPVQKSNLIVEDINDLLDSWFHNG